MSYYFGFNTPEEQKKKRKSDLTAIGEKVTSFFWDIAPANGFEMREGQESYVSLTHDFEMTLLPNITTLYGNPSP